MIPQVKVERLEVEDPTFEGGSTHTATAVMTNPTGAAFTYSVELYLNANKVVTTGVGEVTIGAGLSEQVIFNLTMPLAEGDYQPYLDVSVGGDLIAHYIASEMVTIDVTPGIEIGPIIWV